MIPEAAVPLLNTAPVVATSQRRLTGALVGTSAAGYIMNAVPTNLLLAVHLTMIAGPRATAAFSIVTGVGGFAALIANPLAGRISDRTAARFGRRRTSILIGGLGAALLLVGMSATTTVWQVALLWSAITVLIQFQLAATSALAAEQVSPDRRGAVSGIVAFVSLGGPVIGFGAASAVASLPWLQWVSVAVLGAIGVVCTVLLAQDPQHRSRADAGGLRLRQVLQSYWVSPRKHPAFGWAWAVRFLISCAWATNTYLAFVFTQRFGISTQTVSGMVFTLTLIAIACVAVTAWLTGWLSDRTHRQKPFVLAGGIVLAGGLVMLALAPTTTSVYVAAAVMALGYGLFLATDFALCIRMLPNPESTGKDFAVLNIGQSLPGSLVPLIAPALLALGGFTSMFLILAVFGVLGAVCVIRIPDIGQEGDPRFAPIVRDPGALAGAAARAGTG